ncbi:hypothetical protein [Streptomyces sp. NPDC056549]|uniref:hypothetical protein n=1 Tax=Streptomyces sp. NPDC056549 TaxID=3345864 RepID=UPI00368E8EE5
MRPQRFTEFVIDIARNSPNVQRVQTLAEAGDSKHPFGVVITTAHGETRWQFAGMLPDGAKHATFKDEPVTGTPAPAIGELAAADSPEDWLAAVVSHAQCLEIAATEQWSTAGPAKSQPGVTIIFHNGARIFARQF